MNKMYEKTISKEEFDEKFNFGTDFSDISIIPQIYRMQDEIVQKENEYFIKRCMDLHIEPNVLINQTREIHRLNAVIGQLEKALDKACEHLTSNKRTMVLVPMSRWESTYRDLTKDEWKEMLLSEVQEDDC